MLATSGKEPKNEHLRKWSERGCQEFVSRIVGIRHLERWTSSITSLSSLLICHSHPAKVSCMYPRKMRWFCFTGDSEHTVMHLIYLVCVTILLSPRRWVSWKPPDQAGVKNWRENVNVNLMSANIISQVILVKALQESDSTWRSVVELTFWIICFPISTGRASIGHIILAWVLKACCSIRFRAAVWWLEKRKLWCQWVISQGQVYNVDTEYCRLISNKN